MSRPLKFLLSFVIFVAVCYVGLLWFVNSEVEKGFNEAVDGVAGLTVDYGDLSVDIFDQRVTLTDVDATLPDGQHVTADAVRITSFDQLNPVPHFMKASAENMVVETTTANVGDWSFAMRAMGIPAFKGDVSLDYAYDPESTSLNLRQLRVKMPDLCDADISGSIDRLDLQILRVEKLFGLRIKDLELTFTNHSLVDTLLKETARGMNTGKDDALRQVSAELASMADYAGREDNVVAENALRGLKRYINDPHTVKFSAHPTEPVPLLYFFMGRDLYDNLRLMNVSVQTDSSEDI